MACCYICTTMATPFQHTDEVELTLEGLFRVVTWVNGDDDNARVGTEAGCSSSASLVAERDLSRHPTFLVRHCLGCWE